jgi:uncharacterized RDD family membrane protein YckC
MNLVHTSDHPEAVQAEPAARSTRLIAALLDGLIWGLAVLVVGVISNVTGFRAVDDDPTTSMAGLALFAWYLLLFVVYVWQLAARGQTPGKRLLAIRIVRLDGSRASFGHVVVLRTLLAGLLWLVPGFALVDPLFIFRADRRCLHDLLAGTKVVAATPRRR